MIVLPLTYNNTGHITIHNRTFIPSILGQFTTRFQSVFSGGEFCLALDIIMCSFASLLKYTCSVG